MKDYRLKSLPNFETGLVYDPNNCMVAYTYGNKVVPSMEYDHDRDSEAVDDFAYQMGCHIEVDSEIRSATVCLRGSEVTVWSVWRFSITRGERYAVSVKDFFSLEEAIKYQEELSK